MCLIATLVNIQSYKNALPFKLVSEALMQA